MAEAVPHPDRPASAGRPGLFVAAVLLHAAQALLAVTLGALAAMGCLLAAAIVAVSARSDDAVPAVIVLGIVGVAMMVVVVLGLVGLLLAYKAWNLDRGWVWALLIYSVLAISFQPCGVLVALVTVIGGVQVLERKADGKASSAHRSTA